MGDRQEKTLKGFMGVDYSSSPMDVALNRATDCRNFINENGINKKRNGWSEIYRFAPGADGETSKINGIWHFTTKGKSGKNYTFTIVHAGKDIFTFDERDGNAVKISNGLEIDNARSFGIVSSGKLYVLCGDYLVFGQFSDSGDDWELRRVFNNIDTHTPTTAIALVYDGKKNEVASGDAGAVKTYTSAKAYKVNESANVLTTRRINKMRYEGKDTTTDTGRNIFIVDSKIIDDGAVKISLNDGLSTTHWSGKITGAEPQVLTAIGGEETITINKSTGKITLGFTRECTSQLTDDNLTVEFNYLPRDEKGELIAHLEHRITKCAIGIMFGLGGVDDRLFMAGNAKFGNICFHSSILLGDNSLTYFPDDNTAACGNDGDPITAFSRLGDGTLALHKQSGRNDSNIYYRRGSQITKTDEDSGIAYKEEIFPLTAGAIGEGVISPYGSASLSGDNIILSANGVYGVVLGSNMVTNERYARERSRLINERLLKHNLRNACAIAYKNRYYLAVDNECYIADARFSFAAKGDMPGAYNYEWWHWDNMPVRVWANIDDRLYFGTEKGSLCVMSSEFIDSSFEGLSDGNITLDVAQNGFAVNTILFDKLTSSDRITIATDSGVYAEYINSLSILPGSRLKVNDPNYVLLIDNKEVYLCGFKDILPVKWPPYRIKGINYAELSFELYDGDNKVELGTEPFLAKLCEKLQGKELQVINASNSFFQVANLGAKEPLKLISPPYAGESEPLGVKLNYRRNVCAEWLTPVMDLGTNAYSKNLHRISISSEPSIGGKIEFGFKTRNVDRLMSAKGVATFSFDDIDFNRFSFELNSFATSYTKQLLVRNFNYIILRLRSDNDRAAAVNSIGIEFSIIKKNKGVR